MRRHVKTKQRSTTSKPKKGLSRKTLAKKAATQSKLSIKAKKPVAKGAKNSSLEKATVRKAAPRTEAQYLAKPKTFQDTWERVIEAISKMRSDKVSLTQAARESRVSPRTVTKYGRSALRKTKSGKYTVKKNDNLLRLMRIPAADGIREIAIRGSKQASLLGGYWSAVHQYLQTGDTSRLKEFHGQKITDADGRDIPLLVDPAALNHLGSAGVLSFESIYARTT